MPNKKLQYKCKYCQQLNNYIDATPEGDDEYISLSWRMKDNCHRCGLPNLLLYASQLEKYTLEEIEEYDALRHNDTYWNELRSVAQDYPFLAIFSRGYDNLWDLQQSFNARNYDGLQLHWNGDRYINREGKCMARGAELAHSTVRAYMKYPLPPLYVFNVHDQWQNEKVIYTTLIKNKFKYSL